MIKIYKSFSLKRAVLTAIAFVFSLGAFAQSMVNYQSGFTASSGTFTPITGGTAVSSIQADGVISALLPIGFDFWYMGQKYTQFRASSDGFLSFNGAATNTLTNGLSGTAALRRPLVAPLWDDLDGVGGTASYITTGTAPNRVFTMEWLNWEWNWQANAPTISFQVKLYESTGKIDFVYDNLAGAVNSPSASIGLAAIATGAGNYVSLQNTSASPTTSTTTETTTINAKPATGQIYSFLPPAPLAVTTLVANVFSANQIDLSWTDNATNEVVYVVQYSTDPAFGTSTITTFTANATSASITGLIPNTAYYFNVYPVAEVPGTISTTNGTTPDIPKTITTYTVTQASNSGVSAGTADAAVLKTYVNVQGSLGNLLLNSFAATSLNTDEADISAIKLYVTTNTTFANTTLLASATGFSSGTVVFSGLNYDIPQGDNYFWLTYDVASGATLGNILDAQIDASFIDIAGTPYPVATESPVGKLWVDEFTNTPYYTGFEPSGMAGWTSAEFSATTTTACSNNSVRFNLYSGDPSATLSSPLLGLSTGSVTTLTYDYKIIDWSGGGATPNTFGNFVAQWSNAPGGPWTTFHTVSNDHIPSTSCANKTATFTPAAGNLYVRFVATWASGDYYLYFDNISVANVSIAFSSIAADATKPTITYTPLANGVAGTTRTLSAFAAITDAGTGVDVASGNKPRLYYKKSTDGTGFDPLNDNTVDGWKWVEASNTTTPFDFTIDYNKLFGATGAVDGDIIQYFVVAQDSLRYPAFPAGGNVASNASAGFVGTSVSSITSAPTTPLQYTIAPSIGPVTYTISSTGDYNSISNAGGLFEAINNSVVVGDITAIIAEDITGETGDVALNLFGNSGSEKLFIIPDGTGLKTISGNSTANPNGMIRFNGAKNVLIDGGALKELKFVNDATNSPVMSFRNDCSMDSITNITIEGSVTSATNGLITIGTGYQVGNKNLAFTNNTFKDNSLAGNNAANCIYSQGTSATISNGLITIQGNNFVNFRTNGILVTATGNGAGWLIKDNSFYDDGTIALTTAATAINFKSGSTNNMISGNYIGGSQALAGGTPLATTANYSAMDIDVATGAITNQIYNNTVKNIASTVSTSGLNNNIINVAGSVLFRKNNIGSNDVNERIELNGNNRAFNFSGAGECMVDSNLVANITSISNGVDDWDRFGIFVAGSGNTTIDNNTISDLTNTEKDFGGNPALTYALVVATSGTANITNNYVFNITNTNTNSAITNYVAGIDLEGTTNLYNVVNNRVYNIASSTVSTTTFNQVNAIQQLTGSANLINNSVSLNNNSNSSVRGIVVGSTVSSNVAYNTIYLTGATNVNANSYGLIRTSSATMALRNNLIYNGRTVTSGTAVHYALGNTNSTPSAGWSPVSSANNAIIVSDIAAVGQWGTTTTASTGLGSTFGETGSKVLSTTDAPAADLFVNAASSDLNIDETKATACLIANIGSTVSGLTTDINGDLRSTTTPDPGAYEFDGLVPSNVTPITGSTLACAGAAPISYNTSVSTNATEYVWNFSAGISLATTGLPTDAISVNVAPGTSNGTISVTAKNGCGVSNTEMIIVNFDNALPVAAFSSSTAAAGVAVELFTSTSTAASSYTWNFGDGASSNLVSPAHAYTANGPFNVTLTVSNGCGSDTETKTVQFTVGSEELIADNFTTVLPNPTTDKFVLIYNNQKDSKLAVEVSNVAGQVVYSENVENYTGLYNKEINLVGNATGVYFVKVVSNNNVTTHKVILN